MRAFILFTLLVLPAFAGCADSTLAWAGVGNAYQHQDASIVEIQLHAARGIEPASAATARAGFESTKSIEDATANVTMPNGTVLTFPLADWTMDRANHTMRANLPSTGFDKFHMDATVVLKNGTRYQTGKEINWHEEFARPYQANTNVAERNGRSTLTLTIFRTAEGATSFAYFGDRDPDSTMFPVNISQVEVWHARMTGTNGTLVEESAQPTFDRATLTVELPYTGVKEAQPRFTLLLRDGTRITEHDVDGDLFPVSLIGQRARAQEN